MNVLFVVVKDQWMALIAMGTALKIVNMIVLMFFREPENLIIAVPVLTAHNMKMIVHCIPLGISPVLIVPVNLMEMHLLMHVKIV